MTLTRTSRVLLLGSMLAGIVVALAWAGHVAWRKSPEWRAVRELRAVVEAKEPERFLDAVKTVDSLGVAEAAAEAIEPLRHHPEPRVRVYAVIATTVLRPRSPAEALPLIDLFNEAKEDIAVCRAAGFCLGLFGEYASAAVPSLVKAIRDVEDPRRQSAIIAFEQIGIEDAEPLPSRPKSEIVIPTPPERNATRYELTRFLLSEIDAGR